MIRFDGLLGREFVHETADCFDIVRDFYLLNFGISIPNYARPHQWWEPDADGKHLNLYMDHYHEQGFNLFHGRPSERLPGDVVLMAIRSSVANHAAIWLPEEKILHHLVGQISTIEPFYSRTLFRDTTVAVVRHRAVDGASFLKEIEIDAISLLPKRIRDRLDDARQGTLDV